MEGTETHEITSAPAAGLPGLGIMLSSSAARHAEAAPPKAPNLIVVLADELRWADVAATAKRDIPTPQIDRLAAEGVRCTQAYVSSPWCSPSRAGLLTGRYPQRFGHEYNPNQAGARPEWGLSLQERTIADRLKSAGYATGALGKWHLGLSDDLYPNRRGFDEFFGFRNGAHDYLDAQDRVWGPVERNGKPVPFDGYLTDVLAREAASFIDRHRDQPFFLYLAFNAVHPPHQAPEKYRTRVRDVTPNQRQALAASLVGLDDAMGTIMAALRKAQLDERTMVIFTSDNGRPRNDADAMPWDPLRGGREQMWEGGVRVPFVIRWTGKLPAGKEYTLPISHLDIMATAMALAGARPDAARPLDGVNLMPYLLGENHGRPHDNVYFRLGETWAIRQGDWKLIWPWGDSRPELYNGADDPGETKDVADQRPDLVRQLQDHYRKWNATLAKPTWPYPPGAYKNQKRD